MVKKWRTTKNYKPFSNQNNMDKIMNSALRTGNFTSSEIFNLLKLAKDDVNFGAPAITYIDECNMERKLGRSISTDVSSRPTSWGKLVEKRVFELLGMEYRLCSQDTIQHPEYEFWAGSPDAEKYDEGKTVVDIKCPATMKSFCELVDKTMFAIRNGHKQGEKYYWQLVSNAILTGAKYAELIVYCPYQKELAAIRDMAANYEGNQNHVAWVNWAEDDELPYLPNEGFFKNIKICRFEIPEEDKELLTQKVVAASRYLIKVEELMVNDVTV